jgi:hypothetical protein
MLHAICRILIMNRFRWVECQLDTLRNCLRPSAVIEALNTLPEGLDATYERILSQIPKVYHQEAKIVFALLICARRAISLAEAAEAASIDIREHSFDPKNRLCNPQTVIRICSSFVSLSPFEPKIVKWDSLRIASSDSEKELLFAHYSVQEYLVSERAPHDFRMTNDDANAIVARIALSYLLSASPLSSLRSLPFGSYASCNWAVHAKAAEKSISSYVDSLSKRMRIS